MADTDLIVERVVGAIAPTPDGRLSARWTSSDTVAFSSTLTVRDACELLREELVRGQLVRARNGIIGFGRALPSIFTGAPSLSTERPNSFAHDRARALAVSLFGAEVVREVERGGEYSVPSTRHRGVVYRVPLAGMITRINARGMADRKLCFLPELVLNRWDVFIARVLSLRADEDRTLRHANHFTPSARP